MSKIRLRGEAPNFTVQSTDETYENNFAVFELNFNNDHQKMQLCCRC